MINTISNSSFGAITSPLKWGISACFFFLFACQTGKANRLAAEVGRINCMSVDMRLRNLLV
jgi:hypothetical protein